MFELLEARTLFSASAVASVVTSLQTQESALKADVVAWEMQARSNLQTLSGDIKRVNLTQSDATLLKKYSRDGARGLSKLSVDLVGGVTKINLDDSALISASKRAKRSAGSGTLAADRKKLSAALTSVLNTIEADAANHVTAVDGDLTAIGATSSDSKFQGDISAVETAISAKSQAVDTQIANVSSTVRLLLSDV